MYLLDLPRELIHLIKNYLNKSDKLNLYISIKDCCKKTTYIDLYGDIYKESNYYHMCDVCESYNCDICYEYIGLFYDECYYCEKIICSECNIDECLLKCCCRLNNNSNYGKCCNVCIDKYNIIIID